MAAVLVHIDLDGNRPHASSLAALAAGRRIASAWGATLYAVVIAHDPEIPASQQPREARVLAPTEKVAGLADAERELARGGADKIVVALIDVLVAPLWAVVGGAWRSVLDHVHPRVVLFGADAPSAPELAARSGARIGARLFARARAIVTDELELRDPHGGHARASDPGATVALIGGLPAGPTRGDDDIDLFVLAATGSADAHVELAARAPAGAVECARAVIAVGDDVVADPQVAAGARRLASLLGAELVGGAAAVRAGLVAPGAAIEPSSPLAPGLCIAIGAPVLDLAGTTQLVQIGAPAAAHADGALPGPAAAGLAALLARLEGGR